MSFRYTRTRLENDINSAIQNRTDMLIDVGRTINNAATEVITDFTLRSAKRRSRLSPGIFDDIHSSVCPDDLDAENIIDIVSDNDKRYDRDWSLTTTEVMRNNPHRNHNAYQANSLIAVDEHDNERRILLSVENKLEQSVVIDNMDSADNWTATGDGENLHLDKYSYKKGSGSIAVDIDSSGGSSYGIVNSSLTGIELKDEYFNDTGAIFTYVYLPSDPDKINGFDLKLGSSAANYYGVSASSRHDKTSLSPGWNLIRFDLGTATETGSPDISNISYVEITVNKNSSLTSKKDFKFDHIVLRVEEPHDIFYYTQYPWVSADGVYKAESTTGTDLLVAEADEYKLFSTKATQKAFEEAQEDQRAANKGAEYETMLQKYKMKNTSNALMKSIQYHKFYNPDPGSRSGRILN